MEVQSIAVIYTPWGSDSLEPGSSNLDVPKPPKKRFLEEAEKSGKSQDENEEPLDLSGEFFIRASQQDLINRLVEKLCRKQEDKVSTSSRLSFNFAAQFKSEDLPLKKRNITKGRTWTAAAQADCSSNKYLDFVNKGICKKKNCNSRRS